MKLSDTGSEYCYTFCLLTMLQIWPMANTPLSALTKFEHPSCPSSHFSLPLLSVQLPAVFCSSCFPGWNQVTVIPKPKGINNQLSKWSPKSSLFLNPTLWQRLWRVTKPLLYFFFFKSLSVDSTYFKMWCLFSMGFKQHFYFNFLLYSCIFLSSQNIIIFTFLILQQYL